MSVVWVHAEMLLADGMAVEQDTLQTMGIQVTILAEVGVRVTSE
jgi:hypothetical protein